MAYGLALLLGLALAGTIAFFRYNSVRQKHRRGRVQDQKREQALRADHQQRRTDPDA